MQRPVAPGETIFLIGPGGVGKSTLGAVLAERLAWPPIDLDLEFCRRIAVIGPYISEHGYAAYRATNLGLAMGLVAAANRPAIIVTSPGFLAAPVQSTDYRQALDLVRTGYSVALLPSLDLDEATRIVVARQMTRGFGLERLEETRKFQARFAIYKDLGDMSVVSAAPPGHIATAVMQALAVPAAQIRNPDSWRSTLQ